MEYPKALYRLGHQYQLSDGSFDYRLVESREHQEAAEGWFETTAQALAGAESSDGDQEAPIPNDPPTRAEMEQKAAQLGLKVDKRWGDERLAAEIAAKV